MSKLAKETERYFLKIISEMTEQEIDDTISQIYGERI
jgi:hypothetical protein